MTLLTLTKSKQNTEVLHEEGDPLIRDDWHTEEFIVD